MPIFKKITFYLGLLGLVAAFFLMQQQRKNESVPPAAPLVPPPESPYSSSVAGAGLIEAVNENVTIAPSSSSMIEKVLVKVGEEVKTGQILAIMDTRDLVAQKEAAEARINVSRSQIKVWQVNVEDMEDQLRRYSALNREGVVTDEEFRRRHFDHLNALANLEKGKSELTLAQSDLRVTQVLLEKQNILAPRDGVILQANIREGEYSAIVSGNALFVLGGIGKLQIRVDIDEQNSGMVRPGAPAVAYVKGDTKNAIPLRFTRIEPYVIPKKSLTGASTERVDTRVLQVIYQFDPPNRPLYVGQQVDVYIER